MQLLLALHIVDIELAVTVDEDQTAAQYELIRDGPLGRRKSEQCEIVVSLFSLKDADDIVLLHDKLGHAFIGVAGMVETGVIHRSFHKGHSVIILGMYVHIVLCSARSIYADIGLECSLSVHRDHPVR